MIKSNKVVFKIIGLVLCSMCFISNIVSMFIIAKKTNSKTLKIFSWIMVAAFIFFFVAVDTVSESSGLFDLVMVCGCFSLIAPTFFTLFNLVNYKVAHDIAETVKVKNIKTNLLHEISEQDTKNIEWVKHREIKLAKQMYGKKGNAVLFEIEYPTRVGTGARRAFATDGRILNAQDEQQKAFELAKMKAEKERTEAEARVMKLRREQQEAELAKINAEREKVEAEIRELQKKKEERSKATVGENASRPGVDQLEKTDKYVFVSYSSKDEKVAAKTKEILENSGINCWIAPWSIVAGSDYASEIPKALNGCSAVVLILSKASQESKWVPKEIGIAIENNKIIIPFQIDNETISDSFNFYLTNSQRIAAFNRMNDAYDELTRSLYRLLQIN